jgi:hypothetical protein
MPLNQEFLHHLHELMVEVSEKLANEEAEYKSQLIWKARKTNNAAAMPIAYKDAAIHALRTRFEQTVERYIEALSVWGIEIDAAVEKEMRQHINMLASGPNQLSLPPGIRGGNVQAVQQSYAMERQRVAHQLNLSAANRLRDLNMKTKRESKEVKPTSAMHVYNMPFGRVYNNSIDQSINNFEISLSILRDIDHISVGNEQLEQAAREIHAAIPDKATMLEKFSKWASLLMSVEGLVEKVHQHYPEIETFIKHMRN